MEDPLATAEGDLEVASTTGSVATTVGEPRLRTLTTAPSPEYTG